jgi:protein ImuB
LIVPVALSVYFPRWSIDLLRRRERRSDPHVESVGATTRSRRECAVTGSSNGRAPAQPPVLFIQTTGQRQLIAACCEQSAACGIQVGMTLAHARALLPSSPSPREGAGDGPRSTHDLQPEPRLEPFTPIADAAALEALARWCTRLAPIVAPDPPDGLLMDLSGCERVYKGRRPIVQQIALAMARLGLRARIAMAPSFGCAWAMARFGPPGVPLLIVPEGKQREAISPLPVCALRIDPPTQLALREVAVDRIGDLLRLPRSSLTSRFGDSLLLRIDQALGDAMEVITPVRPPDPVRAEILFDGPTTQHEALQMAAKELLDDLVAELRRRIRGTRRVEFRLIRSDLPPLTLEISTSRPTSNAPHLWKLLRPKLERAQLGFGVEGLQAEAQRLARMRDNQTYWHAPPQPRSGAATSSLNPIAPELIDTLAARFGESRVILPRITESHIPERITRLTSAMQPLRERVLPELIDAPRPTILLDHPEPVEVIALWPDGPPSWMRWRDRELKLAHAAGPERVVGEWWRLRKPPTRRTPLLRHRDYFRVTDESGVCLWLFRDDATARWFVHGLW